MKNIFTKAIVCAGVVASAMALSSIAVFAAVAPHTNTVYNAASDSTGYFSMTKNGSAASSGKVNLNTDIDGISTAVTTGVKLESTTVISFNVKGTATLDVRYAANTDAGKEKAADIKFDDTNTGIYSDNRKTEAKYTVSGLTAGEHKITVGTGQANVYYIRVVDTYDADSIVTKEVSGTVSPKDATISVSSGSVKSNDGEGNVTLSIDEGNTATLNVSANDYISASTDVASSDKSFALALTALEATDDDTNTLSTAQFNASTGITFKNNYTVNGFSVDPTSSGGTFTNSRIQLVKNSVITYTAPSDGTLTVTGASANATATDRGFSLTSSNAGENFDNVLYTSNSAVDKTFDVTKGSTYTITVVGGNINVTSVKFEDSATPAITEGTFEATGGKVVVKGTNAYLVGEFTKLDANGQLSVGDKVFTTDTVYKSVVDGNDTIAAEKDGTYYYAVKVTDLTSDKEVEPLKRFTVA